VEAVRASRGLGAVLQVVLGASAVRSNLGQIARAARRHQRMALDELGRARVGHRPAAAALAPFSSSLRHSAANRRLTPGSLKRLAMVGNTGTASSGCWNAARLRRHCLRTSRSASSAPRFSNLLSAISSAKSSMSIFSSWLAAPYSLVMT